MLAPIVLFVYNRPNHTKSTLEALSRNALANQSILYIYADGVKEGADENAKRSIAATRAIIRSKKWCKEVQIIESVKNKGLADSIISGVSEIVKKYGKVIVLEDDIITSPGFLTYMNNALNFYQNEGRVMHVSAYMFPVKRNLPETFFYNTASCWGWGTWDRAWKHFIPDAHLLISKFKTQAQIERFNINGSYNFYGDLKANATGAMKTWAVKWYASMFFRKGFALHPFPSLVNNIGHDLSGENCAPTDKFAWTKLADNVNIKKIGIKESSDAIRAMEEFYNKKAVKKSLKNRITRILPIGIKSNIKSFLKGPESDFQNEMNRIKTLPRYTSAEIKLFEKPFKILDSASFLFIYAEIFEKEIYKFNTTSQTPTIIDCGANIGLSVLYFKQLYPNARVIAFEPDKKVFDILTFNVKSLGLTDVKLVNSGLWSEETILKFYSEGADGGRVANKSDENSLITIHTELLSKYLSGNVDFLKMDIEGAETLVMEESADHLAQVKNIFIEYHSFTGKEQTLSKILEILSHNKFRYYITSPGIIHKNPFVKVNSYLGMDMQLNIYAIKE